MPIRTCLLLAILLTSFLLVNAQGTLTDAVKGVSDQLRIVKVSNGQYAQRLETTKALHRITFLVTQTDAKGKTNEESYHLNVADLDPSLITFKPNKDVILVTASARQGRKYIRYVENGKSGNFTDRITLYAENPDAAHALVDALRKLVTVAEKSYKLATLPESYDGVALWLKTNTGNEVVGTATYDQALTFDGRNPLLANFRQNKGGKGEEQYMFNVSDLSAGDLKLTTQGEQLVLTLPIRNRNKFIRYLRTGKSADAVNDFAIISTDVDRIRDIEAAWRKLIPLAEKRFESQLPVLKTMADAQKVISAGVRAVPDDKDNISQQIQPTCDCLLTKSKSGKQSPSEETYRFSLDDLAENNSKISVSGGLFTLTLDTGKQRLVSVSKNQARQNYASEIEIVSDDLESIRYLPQAFSKAAQLCRQARKSPVPANSPEATLNWLASQMPSLRSENEELKTNLEATAPGNTCSLRFIERISGRKSVENQYEMLLKYLNAGGVEMNVSGRNVFVVIPTNGKEKMIKTQKDGKPSDYVNNVRIQLDDIEKARYVADAFRQLIRQCSAN